MGGRSQTPSCRHTRLLHGHRRITRRVVRWEETGSWLGSHATPKHRVHVAKINQTMARHVTAGTGAGAGDGTGCGGGSRGDCHRMLGGRPLIPRARAHTQRKEGEGSNQGADLREPPRLTTHVRGQGRTEITYTVFVRILDIESVSWSTPPMVGVLVGSCGRRSLNCCAWA